MQYIIHYILIKNEKNYEEEIKKCICIIPKNFMQAPENRKVFRYGFKMNFLETVYEEWRRLIDAVHGWICSQSGCFALRVVATRYEPRE